MKNYMKPLIKATFAANVAVKGAPKMVDFADNPNIGTPAAYEADE